MKKAEKQQKGLTIEGLPGETEEQAIARTMMQPALQAAATIQQYSNSPIDLDLAALIDCLEKQVDLVENGNVNRIEQMLFSQAHALDAIANNLFRRAKPQEYMNQFESFLKLGLKAQSQCRSTLEALVSMRKPTHLNQTNIAHNQQVNNELEKRKPPNELLEKTDGERLDGGTMQEAVRVDSGMEAMGKKHRSKDT